jgi:hypothetical protein
VKSKKLVDEAGDSSGTEERPPLKSATKQRLAKTEKALYMSRSRVPLDPACHVIYQGDYPPISLRVCMCIPPNVGTQQLG